MLDANKLNSLAANNSDAKRALALVYEALEYTEETTREMDQWLTREPTRYGSGEAERKLSEADRACERLASTLKSNDPLARPFADVRSELQRAKIELRNQVGEVVSQVNGLEAAAAGRIKEAAATISTEYSKAEKAQLGLLSLVAEALRAKNEKRAVDPQVRSKAEAIAKTVGAALAVANQQYLAHSGSVLTFRSTRERLEKYVGKRVDAATKVDATFPEKARQAVERLKGWKEDVDRKLRSEFA